MATTASSSSAKILMASPRGGRRPSTPTAGPGAAAAALQSTGTRVWIEQAAIRQAQRQGSGGVLGRLQSQSAGGGAPSTSRLLLARGSSHVSSSASVSSAASASAPTPGRRLSGGSFGASAGGAGGATTSKQQAAAPPSSATTASTSSDTDSCCGDAASHSSHGRHLSWGWRSGYLLESSDREVVVRLEEGVFPAGSGSGSSAVHPASSSSSDSSAPPLGDSTVVRLGPNALRDGQVVLSNEYAVDDDGTVRPPSDLITLTHLHEPTVVECLQHRYAQDRIYTSTGPVLLALNPFQPVRGLYGEATMRRYWDRAERNLNGGELPPHVYAIADESFRNMMRSLEDRIDAGPAGSAGGGGDVASAGVAAASAGVKGNQSILVSGESGAGKTVTTKFVMKYLAALSQRSAVLLQPEKRAYMKVAELKQTGHLPASAGAAEGAPTRLAAAPSAKGQYRQPSWATASPSRGGGTAASSALLRRTSTGSAMMSSLSDDTDGGGLDSVTMLSGASSNSIEAQVLQSNPILESFGNARTVRNDNSSRFGKFIEIQFTRAGKLVGAQIETYLLEKVRLVTQNSGERNYHVFYELLSGCLDAKDLKQYGLARNSRPSDFKIACSGTYDRRDGVSDQETYRHLRSAMDTMKFSKEEIHNVFGVVAAILHASNLTFVERPGETSELDDRSPHLAHVQELLGVGHDSLNQALCSFTIQAGRESSVKRSLDRARAEKGLEALLKATYGALFSYLVRRINDSIAYRAPPEGGGDDATPRASTDPLARPAATIGVLDIFGFESFTTNSFEQLCINYCNEALQQQFNAFVLRNEQAEYEREGIEWSFIEFPENQDVLDLIEKRGTGILSILDDQCKAPGPSDKAFALDMYNKCAGTPRFVASRKQTATLTFSISHYAGQIEYTTTGFTEKNRDELPKESCELLRFSSNPFVQHLAEIIDESHAVPEVSATSRAPAKLHRADSSVGRATVGGQFRRQLRNLRNKIDLTTPHYVRCLKPNDLLVPDHFDQAIVAEQLRCGGILEAVRVARAGFTQHYHHADFVRRYRTLAWKELAKKDGGQKQHSSTPWSVPAQPKVPSSPRAFQSRYTQHLQNKPDPKPELSPADTKVLCKDLIRILYRKIYQLAKEDGVEIDCAPSPSLSGDISSPSAAPVVKAKTYSFASSTAPSWSRRDQAPQASPSPSSSLPPVPAKAAGSVKSRYTPWERKSAPPKLEVAVTSPTASATTSSASSWKRNGVTSTDYTKVGIQMGKTKVFLRHKAFEVLERIRSREQTGAATKLNSVFRMYLARMAYVPYRDAFRVEMGERRRMFEQEDFKESKEADYADYDGRLSDSSFSRLRAAIAFHQGGFYASDSLVDKWLSSKIKEAIHNPVPRHEWGKQGPSHEAFKWVLAEGIWVKNYS